MRDVKREQTKKKRRADRDRKRGGWRNNIRKLINFRNAQVGETAMAIVVVVMIIILIVAIMRRNNGD